MKQAKEHRFEELYHSHQDRIYRLCLSFVKDEEQSKDLFQEILIKIWKNLDGFRDESSISTWVYRLASNTAINYVNRAHKQEEKNLRIPENFNLAEPDQGHSELDFRLKLLYQAIKELPEMDRIIAALLLEDSSYRQISEVTGITENYVAVKVNRIKTALGKKLNPIIHGN